MTTLTWLFPGEMAESRLHAMKQNVESSLSTRGIKGWGKEDEVLLRVNAVAISFDFRWHRERGAFKPAQAPPPGTVEEATHEGVPRPQYAGLREKTTSKKPHCRNYKRFISSQVRDPACSSTSGGVRDGSTTEMHLKGNRHPIREIRRRQNANLSIGDGNPSPDNWQAVSDELSVVP